MATTEDLVKRLREASKAYYETDVPIMSDAEYDSLLETLQKISPNHPYLKEVGSTPSSEVVTLPVPMPSLDKRKPDILRGDDLQKGPYIITEKLDGISALWVCGYNKKPALYLRGNGLQGQNVSHCIADGIQGLQQCSSPSVMVRGELICPKGEVQGTLARNWVNGVLHQKAPSKKDLQRIKFMAYQVCEPRTLTRSQQITWLLSQGFEVAWSTEESNLTVDKLKEIFSERRNYSPYECDGIVVGQDCIPAQSKDAANPKDAYAFKMPTDDQRATTIVKEVEWASSRTGNWIPRIRFDPVKIGTATIEYATGINGQFIKKNSIGPSATVLIRRSGDVIPAVETVLTPCPRGWQEPPNGKWAWDENEVHCIDTSEEETPEKLALEMEHQLVSLGIEGISKVTAKKLVVGGLKRLFDVSRADVSGLQKLIGTVNGKKLSDGILTAFHSASQDRWIRAFLGWPKGFGETRILATLELEKDVSKWPQLATPPKGQSAAAFEEIKKTVTAYLKWRAQFPQSSVPMTVSKSESIPVAAKGFYVMTGFRDQDLQAKLAAAGWSLQDRITKTTNVLLINDDAKETTKVKAAKEGGIRIIPRSQVNNLF
jgi:DNA ligase (NAD+)